MSIKSNEFRLGNLIKYTDDDSIFTVIEITPEGFGVINIKESTWMHLFQLSGIHITSSMMLEMGFSSRFSSDPQEQEASKVYTIYGFNIDQPNERKDVFYYEGLPVLHVHQLQNLIFALSNKEITINK